MNDFRSPSPSGWAGAATRAGRVVAAALLCGLGAEVLSAYGAGTGNPGTTAFELVFFALLYGAPALLVRDVVRRAGGGWPSMLLLFTALGVMQACLIDQSLFSADYQGYEGWGQARAATLIPALGISGSNALNFISGHLIFSFGAPIAVAEAWAPSRSREPWLGLPGLVLAALGYLGAAVVVHHDPESHSAGTAQLVVSIVVVLALVAAAIVVAGRRGVRRPGGARRSLPGFAVAGCALLPAVLIAFAAETWAGTLVSAASMAGLGVALAIASRRTDWGPRQAAAVGLAFLLARGLGAFTYFPLAGEVTPAAKYTHNAVMLLIVLAAGWPALTGVWRGRWARART